MGAKTINVPENFIKIKKQYNSINQYIEQAVIVVLKDGTVIGCKIDDYEDREIVLYNIDILKNGQWQPQREWFTKINGKYDPDDWQCFDIDQIDCIYTYNKRDLDLDQTEQVFINPNFKVFIGIDCSDSDSHLQECSKDLHEALSTIMGSAYRGIREKDPSKYRT